MALAAAGSLIAPVSDIDGFLLACLIDAATGMVLASAAAQDDVRLPVAAAGAADLAGVLSLIASELAQGDELEDVMVTFGAHFYLVRTIRGGDGQHVLLLVMLDRGRANLALARRQIREFCAGFGS